MSFEVEVRGTVDRTLRLMLSDVVGSASIRNAGDSTLLSVVDQAALVSVITYLNDLGASIERVRRL